MNDIARWLRKGLLFYLLLLVAVGHWLSQTRATRWQQPLWVTVHPINGDNSDAAERYIRRLKSNAFEPIATFMADEAAHHGVGIEQPLKLTLGAQVSEQPPAPPRHGNALEIMLWSLKLRWWSWNVDRGPDPPPHDITVFIRYFDPTEHSVLAHSMGLQKGFIGVVNAFADRRYAGSNQVIIAHEVLHTLGATDKYDPASGMPHFPNGYAEPTISPRHPQSLAELMGGRIPIDERTARIPTSLAEVVIGDVTASEINWE